MMHVYNSRRSHDRHKSLSLDAESRRDIHKNCEIVGSPPGDIDATDISHRTFPHIHLVFSTAQVSHVCGHQLGEDLHPAPAFVVRNPSNVFYCSPASEVCQQHSFIISWQCIRCRITSSFKSMFVVKPPALSLRSRRPTWNRYNQRLGGKTPSRKGYRMHA